MKRKITTILLAMLLVVGTAIGLCACANQEDIDNAVLPVEQQVTLINTTLDDMKATDKTLNDSITALTGRVSALETELVDVNTKITALQTDSVTKEQFENVKTSLQNQIDSLNAEITALKAKDEDLQGKITALQNSLTSEINDVKAWANDTFLSIANWNTAKAKIEGDITALNNKVSDIESTLTAMNATVTALQQQVDKNTQDIEDLTNRINCLEGKHAYDRTQIVYIWSDNWQFCEFSIPCKHCDATWENGTANLSYDNFKLTAIFDQKDNVEPAVLDISDAREFTVDEITMAVSRMISNGEADNVEVKLTLADDADSAIFAAIVEGMANASNGSVTLVLKGDITSIPIEAFKDCEWLRSISIPDSVTSIEARAFYGTALETITFGENSTLTNIESWAFQDCCNLSGIIIPKGVTSIGISAFQGCSSLVSITLPDGVKIIEDDLFFNCVKLESVAFANDITSIKMRAFYNCLSLKEIIIPKSVENLGFAVFADCTSIVIRYEGTIEEWNAIIKTEESGSWNEYIKVTEVVCSDGTVKL